MKVQIPLLEPRRKRNIPARFSWIDQKLVHQHHLRKLSSEAAALYLFINCVSDAIGMSFYSDSGINQRLQIKNLASARSELISANLLAYRAPFYQLLALEEPLKCPVKSELNKPRSISRESYLHALKNLAEGGSEND